MELSRAIRAFKIAHEDKIYKLFSYKGTSSRKRNPQSKVTWQEGHLKKKTLMHGMFPPDFGITRVSGITLYDGDSSCELWIKTVKYARTSTTLTKVNCHEKRFNGDGYALLITVLYTNTSIRTITIHETCAFDQMRIFNAFINALRLNPVRDDSSRWIIDNDRSRMFEGNDPYDCFSSMCRLAKLAAPPSMLEFLLCVDHDIENIRSKTY